MSFARLDSTDRRSTAPDVLDLLEQFGSTVSRDHGNEIYAQGDPTNFCYKIIFGCARTVVLLGDGRRQIAEFLWTGDFFGFDELDQHEFAAEAITDLSLRRYPRRMVEALAQTHLALALRLRTLTETKLRQARNHMMVLGRKNSIERIACFLSGVDERSMDSHGDLLALPMSRTDIADHLGLTIETVSRAIGRLRDEGTLAVLPSGIELLNRVALSKWAMKESY